MGNENNENTPLTVLHAPSRSATFALCCILITLSVSLINFNKWIMAADRFPHSIPLVLIQMCLCSVMALILIVAKPSLFPALKDPDTKIDFTMRFYVTGCLPVAVVFAGGLVLGNMVYTHLGLAFIQMLKESNIVFVYALSVIFAIERCSMRNIQVICMVIVGMSMTIKGEVQFELLGFMIQITAVLCEAVRIVMQSVLLKGQKMDPLSYVLVMSPSCGVVVLFVFMALLHMPDEFGGHDLALPPMSLVIQWAPWLVANSILAFSLNICIAMVIKYTSALSYIMCGILKDIVAVLVSIVVLKEKVSLLQALGFCLEIFSVYTWSLLKADPEKFESGMLAGLRASFLPEKQVPQAEDVLRKA